eukprot:777173-Pleurochrysis_carterae.AAC.1
MGAVGGGATIKGCELALCHSSRSNKHIDPLLSRNRRPSGRSRKSRRGGEGNGEGRYGRAAGKGDHK